MSKLKAGLSHEAWKVQQAQEAEQRKMREHWASPPSRAEVQGQVVVPLQQQISQVANAHNIANQKANLAVTRTALIMQRLGITDAEVEEYAKREAERIRAEFLAQPFGSWKCQCGQENKVEGETIGSVAGKEMKCEACEKTAKVQLPPNMMPPAAPPAPAADLAAAVAPQDGEAHFPPADDQVAVAVD